MSKKQTLRVLINQRLSLAAAEIFELFERSIAEYEEQLCRSKEENQRQQKLLEAVYSPEVRLHRTDDHQLVVIKEELPPEQQEGNQELEQEESELPHTKEEEEELWSCQEGEQLQVPLKEEETPQSSQESRDSVEGPGSTRNSDLKTDDQSGDSAEPEAEVLNVHHQKKEAHSVLKPAKKGPRMKVYECPQCGKRFSNNSKIRTHMRIHTGEKPFSCTLCGRKFNQNSNLKSHIKRHIGDKPFSCSLCSKRFTQKCLLQNHFKSHTGEKPYRCTLCGKSFSLSCSLKLHMPTHTGDKPFTCKSCNESFAKAYHLKKHKCGGESSVSELQSIDPDDGEKVQSSQQEVTQPDL